MVDKRKHRGPHPQDRALFAEDRLPILQRAANELAWLVDRGYAEGAALKLVGERYRLHRRQREALRRTICTAVQAARRAARRSPIEGRRLVLDGFNVLINLEAALSGGLLLLGRDGWIRNLASMRGSYRLVEETPTAIAMLAQALKPAAEALWYLDRPVSNGGRLATALRDRGFEVILADDVDGELVFQANQASTNPWLVASADSAILDRVKEAVDLPQRAIAYLDNAWVLRLPASN